MIVYTSDLKHASYQLAGVSVSTEDSRGFALYEFRLGPA